MSPKMIVSKDGVRYPADFAEQHGIEAAQEVKTPSAADRTHTHAGIGTVVQDDAAGSVISSRTASLGLADPALTEAEAAAAAGKGEVGTAGATDNTTAGGTTGQTTTTAADAGQTTTTENGATDGTSGDGAAAGDADGAAGAGSTSNRRSAKGK